VFVLQWVPWQQSSLTPPTPTWWGQIASGGRMIPEQWHEYTAQWREEGSRVSGERGEGENWITLAHTLVHLTLRYYCERA